MPQSKKKLICFEHLPRSGGLSVVSALRLQYGETFVGLGKVQYNYIPEYAKILYGHRAFRAKKSISEDNIKYFTFLRQPEKRIVSHFRHIANSIKTKHYRRIKKGISLEKYLKDGLSRGCDNGMVRRISNVDFPYGECSEEIYCKAVENLEKKFFFVGLTELFDESILGLSKVLNWQDYPLYLRRNLAVSNRHIVLGDYKELLLELNKYDIRLYNSCKDKLLNFIKENQDFYDVHLEIFRNTLKVFQDEDKLTNEFRRYKIAKIKEKIRWFFVNFC
jgi:hypothetical protein